MDVKDRLRKDNISVSIRRDEYKHILRQLERLEDKSRDMSEKIWKAVDYYNQNHSKNDRSDKVYREDEEDDDWAERMNKRLDDIEDKLENDIRYKLENDFALGGDTMRADENEKIKDLKKERTEKFSNDSEELVELMEGYRADGLSKVEALKKARIELFQGDN